MLQDLCTLSIRRIPLLERRGKCQVQYLKNCSFRHGQGGLPFTFHLPFPFPSLTHLVRGKISSFPDTISIQSEPRNIAPCGLDLSGWRGYAHISN